MSLDSALFVAAGGLANVSRQMAVVSNNVANAATPDYAREVATQTSVSAAGQSFGVFTGPVVREIDLQLQTEAFHQNATVACLQTRQAALQPIDALQGTPSAGSDLSSMLGKLQDSFTMLQGDPSSSTSQTQVVNSAGALCGKINALSRSYGVARQGAQINLQSGVTALNGAVVTASELTDKIVIAQQAGVGSADLENQRDITMHAISKLLDVTFIKQLNGGMLCATSGGLAIQLRVPAPQFMLRQSATSPQNFYPGGAIQGIMLNGADVTGQMIGGQLGANIALRDKVLPTYQGELDEFALTLQSRLSGQGLQLFAPAQGGAPHVVTIPVQAGYLGYAGTISVNPNVLANPALIRDGTSFIMGSSGGASAFTPNPVGGPASFGTLIERVLTFSFGTQAQTGVAQFTPNSLGLGSVGTLSAPFVIPSDLAGFSTALVASQSGDVAAATSQLATETSVQTTLQAHVTTSSGISTDAELSVMVGLQNAYGANARVMSASQAMWNQLMTTVT